MIAQALSVAGWSGGEYAGSLRYGRGNPAYNPDFRQLIHVGFKVSAEVGARYLQALEDHESMASA